MSRFAEFDSGSDLVIVTVRLTGPGRSTFANMALDTGSTNTVVNKDKLTVIGYGPSSAHGRAVLTTAGGTTQASRVRVAEIEALGRRIQAFSVISHTLPESTGVDGLLGLDFLRNHRLTIDFQRGRLQLR